MKNSPRFVRLSKVLCLLLTVSGLRAAVPAETPSYQVFPIGLFDINTLDDLDAAKQLGCNFVETRAGYIDEAYTEKARSLGLAVVPFLLDGKMAMEDLSEQFRALKLERFRDKKVFPVLFPIDEPSGGRVPVEIVLATYREMKKILPQPQVTVLNRVLETPMFFDGYDILSLDPYPVVYASEVGGRLSTVSQEVDLAKKENGDKPLWVALQAFGEFGGWQRAPRGDELVAMAGLAVTHGADGLWYYSWDAGDIKDVKKTPELQEAIKTISQKMASVSPLLTAPAGDTMAVQGPAHVRVLGKDEGCAVLVAHSGYDQRTVSVTAPQFEGAQLAVENPAIKLNGSTLTFAFPSCGFEIAHLKLASKAAGPIETTVAIAPEAQEELVLNEFAAIAASSNSPGEPGSEYRELKMGDGSLNSNWASAQQYKLPITIQVKFEKPRTVSQIVIHPMIMEGAVGYDAWGDTQVVTSDGQTIDKSFTAEDRGPYTFDLKPAKIEGFEITIHSALSATNYLGCREIEIH